MASRNFSFPKMQKSFFTTTLKDGRTLAVNMPKKKTLEAMVNIDTDEEDSGQVFEVMAEILSDNKSGERITKEEVEENYDIEDVMEYFKGYGDFVSTLNTDPN